MFVKVDKTKQYWILYPYLLSILMYWLTFPSTLCQNQHKKDIFFIVEVLSPYIYSLKNVTRDWTQVSRTIDECSTHLTDVLEFLKIINQ